MIDLEGSMRKQICFVCTGNYFRSRFAEAWFNHKMQELKVEPTWSSISRGLKVDDANSRAVISPLTEAALQRKKISLKFTGEKPTTLTQEDCAKSAMIICIDLDEHRPMMNVVCPGFEHKTFYWNVKDLYGDKDPKPTFKQIEKHMWGLVGVILPAHKRSSWSSCSCL